MTSGAQDSAALARKLGLRAGQHVALLDAPDSAAAMLCAALPGDVDLDRALRRGDYDLIIVWTLKAAGLEARFADLQACISPDGAIWAVLPKRAVARQRGLTLTWDALQSAALSTDLVDNKIASINDEEYATRFVIRKELRPGQRSSKGRLSASHGDAPSG